MSDDVRRLKEEEHFHKKDKELIANLRKKADAERREHERQHRRALHWMKCPKCGHDMKEVEMGPVRVDKCVECGGVYFDAGEVDILLAVEADQSLLGRLLGRKRRASA